MAWMPIAVRFPHARPEDYKWYRRLFGAGVRVTFGSERCEPVAPLEVLSVTLLTADSALHPI